MTTTVLMVTGVLIATGLATGAVLGGILQENLAARVQQASGQASARVMGLEGGAPGATSASAALEEGGLLAGALLVVWSPDGEVSGAYADDGRTVVPLSDQQVGSVVESELGPTGGTIEIPGLGAYRVAARPAAGHIVVAGLPDSEVTDTVRAIAAAAAVVTGIGLVALALVVGGVIRHSLAPLRSVVTTAERVARQPLATGTVAITDRVPERGLDADTEVGRVGMALNLLLDHVDSSLSARADNEERMRRFVADASHELRTPLASIRGFSELGLRALRDQGPTEATNQTAESLTRIESQSKRMTALVEDLLLLARLDEGRELSLERVDLVRLAVECVVDARPVGTEHHWRLEVPEHALEVLADASRISQVMTNLVANARIHTPPGTTVVVTVADIGTGVEIRVQDDGPGVEPQMVDRVFERFARADASRTRRTGGTGLGLSIAAAIVEAHQGRISLDSRPGCTTFTVWLPNGPLDRTE
ncbi:HAMP domain-containing sensor histidine kinase [Serinibacter salmoneus]